MSETQDQHLPNEQLELISETISGLLPENQPYVFVTGPEHQDDDKNMTFDFLSNVEPSAAAVVLRDVADAIEGSVEPEAMHGRN